MARRRLWAILFALVLAPGAASASAWTRPSGEALFIATALYDRAWRRYSLDGATKPNADFTKFSNETYVEYGLADGLTGVLHGRYEWLRDGASGQSMRQQGFGDFELALRLRLYDRPRTVFSVQQMIGAAGESSGGGDLPLLARGRLYETRGLFGRSFDTAGMPAFFNLEAAHRWREGAAPNEWRFDFTVGVKPGGGWEIFAQSFSSLSAGGARTPFRTFRHHKAQISVLKRLTARYGVQAGLFRSVDGRNVIVENGAIVSLWITTDALSSFWTGL
ncbi:MAG: hypothetical protein Tsb0010_08200 [Parvularculaceae bacterium]